jgi:hypothetical protein
LGIGETGSGAANATFNPEGHALCGDWLINAVKIVEKLAVLQRPIGLLSRLQLEFRANAKMFVEHNVAAEP